MAARPQCGPAGPTTTSASRRYSGCVDDDLRTTFYRTEYLDWERRHHQQHKPLRPSSYGGYHYRPQHHARDLDVDDFEPPHHQQWRRHVTPPPPPPRAPRYQQYHQQQQLPYYHNSHHQQPQQHYQQNHVTGSSRSLPPTPPPRAPPRSASASNSVSASAATAPTKVLVQPSQHHVTVLPAEVGANGKATAIVATRPRPQHLSQILAALAVSLGPFAAGLGKGYSSPAIASLEQQSRLAPLRNATGGVFLVTAQQASWVASLSLLGALFGGLLGGLAMRFGRRKVLLLTSLPFSASWLATVFASSVEMMFATAFVGGFCCAIVLVVTQVYISEISVPDIRGCLSAVLKIVGHAGTLISFAVGAYLDWRQLAAVVAAAPLLLFAAALCVPETPSFLVVAGRDAEAARALRWLRGPGADVRKELATLRNNVLAASASRSRCPNLSSSPGLLRPVLTTCGLMLFQRFSGAHAFNFYAVPIFRKTLGGMDPHGGAVAVALVQLLASLLSGLLIDTAGRLPLLLASSTLMSMALAGFGSFAYYEDVNQRTGTSHLDWIPLLCVLVFTVAFSLGISPISWLLIGELFPLEHRELGSAIATAFSYVCAFVGVKTFVDFEDALGLHGAFWLYAAVSLAGLCFVVCCVPETKGKDLDEMHPKCTNA